MDRDFLTPQQAAELGAYIRAARQQRGMKGGTLAHLVQRHESNIFRLEVGKARGPDPALLQRISIALEVPLSDLYALAGMDLPPLQPYLRSSYGLTAADAAKAQAYIEGLAARYGADGFGPMDDSDEEPEQQDH